MTTEGFSDFGQPVSPSEPPKSNKTMIWVIVIVVLLVLCCCCVLFGGAGGTWLWNNGDALLGL